MRTLLRASFAGAMVFAVAGCATTVNNQAVNSIYQTHKIVREIRGDLAPRITELNRTSAELLARVDASETQARQLQTIIQENQIRFEAMQAKLDEIADVVYENLRTSPGAGAYSPSGISGPPATYVVPPSETSLRGEFEAPGTTVVAPVVGSAATANAVADFNGALQSLSDEDYTSALNKFDTFLKRYPKNDYTHRARFWKGRCLCMLERFDEAVAEFELLRQGFPNSDKVPISMRYQATAHLQLGQREEAKALLEELIRKYPSDLVTPSATTALRNLNNQG